MPQEIATQIPLVDVPQLIPAGQVTPPRPSHRDPLVQRRAAEILYEKVGPWLDAADHGERDEKSRIMADLIDVLKRNIHSDGYELTKYLENTKGWAADSELVQIMDDAGWCERRAIQEHTSQWVQVYGITSPVKVLDRVRILSNNENKGKIGSVVSINTMLGECNVRTTEQGIASSWVLTYEQVEVVTDGA
jgi:hypothetical protein